MSKRIFSNHVYRTPSVFAAAALLVIALAAPALAQDASVVYLEGNPEHRTAGGRTNWLDFGTTLAAGDSVVTGRNDFVELEQDAAATIRVNPSTVFTIREVEQDGRRRQVMSNSTGSVGYRFNRLVGRDEPIIGTSSVVAGVRGTEVTVYAGANGSSLFLVETGLVDITAAGETVSLTQNEGVEVPAGGPPGQKFTWLGETIDYSTWEADQFAQFLTDPLKGIAGIQMDLYELAADAREYYGYYQELSAQRKAAEAKLGEMKDQEFLTYRGEVVIPLQQQARISVLNYRYYALSALSLRRHVLGKMFVEMKTRYIMDRDNPLYRQYADKHAEILRVFEDQVVPYLVTADI